MKLIDADALKDKVNSLIDDFPIEKEDEFWNWAVKLCVEEIDKAPTVFDCRSCRNNGNEGECVDCHDYSNFVKYEERPAGEDCVNIKMSEEEIKQFKQMLQKHTPLCTITSDTFVEGARVVRPTGEWIPVSEKLPDDMQEVLVWFEYYRYGDYNCMYPTYGLCHVLDGKWSPFINGETGWQDARIIAWCPIPEPYKETDNE